MLALGAVLMVGVAAPTAAHADERAASHIASATLVPELDPSNTASAVSLLLAVALVLSQRRNKLSMAA
jgi:hypothetical protein